MKNKITIYRRWLAKKIGPKLPMTATEASTLTEIANRKFCNTGCRTSKCASHNPFLEGDSPRGIL